MAITKSVDAPRSTIDAVNLTVDGLDANDSTDYDADTYPQQAALVYRFRARLTGEDDLLSHRFSPNGGTHVWPSVIFPAAGTWTVTVRDTSDDSEIQTANVVVS